VDFSARPYSKQPEVIGGDVREVLKFGKKLRVLIE
jgi:hypothetical protein